MATKKNAKSKLLDTIILSDVMTDFPENTTTTIDHGDSSFSVRKIISIVDIFQVVDEVLSVCFGDNATFTPHVKDIAIKSAIMEHYAGISIPDDIRVRYSLVMRSTTLFEKIVAAIDPVQYRELVETIDDAIEYKKATCLSMAVAQNEALHDRWERLAVELNELFGDMSSETMKQMINTIANGKLDERKIVDAILAARAHEGSNG